MLAKYKGGVNMRTTFGKSPLHLACLQGHLKVVKYLLDEESEEGADNDGQLPIHDAACGGNLEIIKLLEKQEDIYAFTNHYKSMLYLAACKDYLQVIQYLCSRQILKYININGYWLIHEASIGGNFNLFKLLANIEDICVVIKWQLTALYLATFKGGLEITQFLIKEDFNLDCFDAIR